MRTHAARPPLTRLLVMALIALTSTAALAGEPPALASGAGRSRRPGMPGHWPRGIVWASSGTTACWMGYHLERLMLRVPPGAVAAPDGRRLAWVDRGQDRPTVRVGPIPEGPWISLFTAGAGTSLERPRWSPRGGWLVVTAHGPGGSRAHLLRPAEGGRSLSFDALDVDVAPDERTAALALPPAAGGAVVLVDLVSGHQRVLARPPDPGVISLGRPRFDAAGARLLVVETWRAPEGPADQVVWVLDVASGASTLLLPRLGPAGEPAWSPDGGAVAYLDETGRLMAVEVATRRRVVLVDGPLGQPASSDLRSQIVAFAWTPDSAAVVFAVAHMPRGTKSSPPVGGEVYAVDVGEPATWGLGEGPAEVLSVLALEGIPR